MHKLQHYGIIGKSVRWTQNWLENRKQSVVIDGSTSDAVKIYPITIYVFSGIPGISSFTTIHNYDN
jgi:predicted dinucleotide-utilizing enzyme